VTRRRGGWRRVGRNRYVDQHGRRLTDAETLERIAELAIPPAWRDVWISPSRSAKLQAAGLDRAGRRQYLYHPDFRAAREQEKYDRLVRFGELLPGLRSRVTRHVDLGPYHEEWACAVAVTLVNRAWFRVGSERSARSARTYGITTLHKRHVEVRGTRVAFRFRAKGGVLVRTTLVDEAIADTLRTMLDLRGGSRLLRFTRGSEIVNLTAPLLNAYIDEHLGPGFTAKDFRTWGGTLTAALALAEHGPPESEIDAKRAIAAAMRKVGKELGNTPAVARASYLSPAVLDQFREGRTLDDFRSAAQRTVSSRQRGFTREERALLSLIRSWRVRRARRAA
jgi:DNA topoisomerase-1